MENIKTTVILVNIDNYDFTKQCLEDLSNQTTKFKLVYVENGSKESSSLKLYEDLKMLPHDNFELLLVKNDFNKPLNWIWNEFIGRACTEYVCCLNNDTELTENFISDSETILDLEPAVGIVSHCTNHPNYSKATDLNYVIVDENALQGWDFTIRKSSFTKIPTELEVYAGDTFLFNHILKTFKQAFVLSSPIIHYQGMSRKSRVRNPKDDTHNYNAKFEPNRLSISKEYSMLKPTFDNLIKFKNGYKNN